MSDTARALYDALNVLMRDPHIASHIDRKASEQARNAIVGYAREQGIPVTLPVSMDDWVCVANSGGVEHTDAWNRHVEVEFSCGHKAIVHSRSSLFDHPECGVCWKDGKRTGVTITRVDGVPYII